MQAVFFDLDGTLLDTLSDIHAHVNKMLSAHGYPAITREQAREYVGDGAAKLIGRALPQGADFEECFAEFLSDFAQSDNSLTRLYEGEREALNAMKERGLKLAVITNKPQEATASTLNAFFPRGYFDFVGGDSGMFPCKPDPSLTRYAALTLRVAPRECVFVGDGETDVRTAAAAGMRGIAALWGYRSRERLLAAGAREFAESFGGLWKILADCGKNFSENS